MLEGAACHLLCHVLLQLFRRADCRVKVPAIAGPSCKGVQGRNEVLPMLRQPAHYGSMLVRRPF